ncbi:unnamed protein product [Acanthosepion pharaonis]|uniref:Uncharacterized protein n=1 Tax=Acanthosepion pharaonis TaxID=158019 RepID=A0A812CC18_ACAPH|nr:unnamed protein product [Sepia pharaonis]
MVGLNVETNFSLIGQGAQTDLPKQPPPIISYHSPNSRVEDTEPPNDRYPTNTRDASQSQYTSDLVRYFTWQELITTGLPPFNDRPEDYRVWKRSFQNAIRHLGLAYREEMDLLVKRLDLLDFVSHNGKLAERRLSSLRRRLDKKPEMQRHFLSFMEGLFENGHAEAAPPLRKEEECWVFTSFRKEIVAITADIKQMFHCFSVKEEHRNFLRFLWYRDNDPTKGIAEYSMKVHVFVNSPSPAVAIYCLRQAVRKGQPNYNPAVEELVNQNFYIDDCLKSLPTIEATVSLLQRTRDILARSNLRLHKIASNKGVMTTIPPQDHANNLMNLDLSKDELPIQRSLGLEWHLKTNTFTFKLCKRKSILKNSSIANKEELPKGSTLKGLNPFIDSHSLLRIGGHAGKAEIETRKKHPIVIPGKHHIGSLATTMDKPDIRDACSLRELSVLQDFGWLAGRGA